MAFSEAFLEWERQTQEKSKQEGRQEERRSIALKLLQQGVSIEAIAQVTDLSIAEIQALQSQQN
jgi:predicted transposase/invertase (TIGR01784 family)